MQVTRPLSITVTIPATAVTRTTAAIRRLDFRYLSDMEMPEYIKDRTTDTRVTIQDSVDTTMVEDLVDIQSTVVVFIAHGTTLATMTITHPHSFHMATTLTMFQVTTTCIVQAIGIHTIINCDEVDRLLALCRQAV